MQQLQYPTIDQVQHCCHRDGFSHSFAAQFLEKIRDPNSSSKRLFCVKQGLFSEVLCLDSHKLGRLCVKVVKLKNISRYKWI